MNSVFCEGLIKTDFDGNLLWKEVIFYDSITTNDLEAFAIRNDTIFVNVNYTHNPPYLSVLAFDLQGNYLGRFDYGEPGGLNGTYWARDIATGNDRLFVTYQYRKPGNQYLGKAEVYDLNGQKLWEVAMPDVYSSDLEPTGDGGMFLLHTACYPCKAYVRKFDPAGGLIWQTLVPDLTEDNGGGAGILGYLSAYPDGGVVGIWPLDTFAIHTYGNPCMVFKMNAQGEVEWTRLFITHIWHDLFDVFPTQNGDLIVCGMDANLTSIGSDSLNYYGGYVSRLNAAGETLWERRIFDIAKGQTDGWFFDGLELPDGDLLLCGEINDSLPDDPYPQNAWLVRLDSAGCITPGCGTNEFLLDDREPSGAAHESLFTAFPVPFRNHVHLVALLGRHIPPGDYRVALFDAAGRLLLEKPFEPRLSIELDTHSAPPGTYSLVVRRDGLVIQTIQITKT